MTKNNISKVLFITEERKNINYGSQK